MLTDICQVIQRNLDHFESTRNGLVLDCMDEHIIDVLPESFTAFTTSRSVYQKAQSGGRMTFGVLPEVDAKPDTVLVIMPKSKPELRFQLAWIRANVQPGGNVYLVGAKKEGIASGAKLLDELGGQPTKIDVARHCQLWQVEALDPVDSFYPGDWETTWSFSLPGAGDIKVCSLPGVFSHSSLDKGTACLLETLEPFFDDLVKRRKPLKGEWLDFACGAGVIAAYLLKRFPELTVTCVDNSAVAIHCAKRTFEMNGLSARFIVSDGLAEVSGRYHGIVTNPPFHSGVKTDYSVTESFIADISLHLKRKGQLFMVANSFLRYPQMIREVFPAYKRLAADNRFAVHYAQMSG
ncbi:MAG: 16S rRNA methyltransferase [Proteobacteria bacterium]|nr:MAG: 16S rRNA methyltransferase [Pseudomonadota bacterium]PIE40331.1 MAG: 16S rRNA methyltransferase [Gammaproteobacteria bacterium]